MADMNKTVGIVFRATDQASAVTAKLAETVRAVGEAASGSATGTNAAAAATQNLGTKQHEAVLQLEKTQTQVAALKIAYGQLSGNTEAVAQGQELLARKFAYTGTEEERLLLATAKLSAENDLAKAKVGQLGDELERGGNKAATLVTAFKALAASVVVKEFIDANVEAEKFMLGMKQIAGSTEGARKEFDYVRDVANKLGIGIKEAAEGFLTFSAATKGSAFEGEKTKVIFEAVAGTMASLGRSSSETNGIMVQLSQGISKGKFELEDLKSIAERMPGFFNNFASALGVSTAELYSMISAGQVGGKEFLLFAEKINQGLAAVEFNTFEANLARLKNAVNDAFLQLGDAGVMDALTKGLQLVTASLVGAVSGFRLLGEVTGAVAGAVVSRDFSMLGDAIDAAMDKAANSTRGARDALLGYKDEADKVGPAVSAAMQAQNESAAETARLMRQNQSESDKLADSLKALGIKPEQVKGPLNEILNAFEALASNPAVSGAQILAGLKVALKDAGTLDDIGKIGGALTTAFVNGRMSADEFSQATVALGDKQGKLQAALDKATGAGKEQAEQLKKTEEAARKAEERAQKYAIEMEKIASNERIKLVEARVTLNVAEVQEQTKRIQAAFDSINTTIESTGDVIGKALGSIGDLVPNTDNFRIVQAQLDKENQLRREAFELQKEMSAAQVAYLRAQTQKLQGDSPVLKVDGAGLQPHLEAFMWEILKAIQVRVNNDGLKMLLGV